MSKSLETPPVERAAEPWTIEPDAPARDGKYVPFGNVETRNGLQALIEIPLMIRALRLPRRQRILEIGCGRGVALPVLDERLTPIELVGLDIDPCYHASDTMHGRRTALSEVARVLRHDGLFVHETRVAQRLAHPVRSLGRSLPWRAVPSLVPDRSAVLWGVKVKRR